MTNILVTGANGQLAKCIKDASETFPNFNFIFLTKETLDINTKSSLDKVFKNNTFQYCINTAAYTNVEKAESNKEEAFAINAEAVKSLAIACKNKEVTLVHISTDYVFNGEKESPYTEEDITNPINVYGTSKLKGEQNIIENCPHHFIIRTSWLYSQYGHNFFNSILKFAEEKKDLKITTEQVGTPTNANDLAKVILDIIKSKSVKYGVYHYSNSGETTWYGFAKKILSLTLNINKIKLEKTNYYPTFATRPKYSVLDTKKAQKAFYLIILDWETSLKFLIKYVY